MKKFFSLFCALAIVLGVNAKALDLKTSANASKVKKTEVKKVCAEKKAVKTADFKQFNQKNLVVKATKGGVAKAPQAKKEVVDINIAEDVTWVDNVASSGWWQISASDETFFQVSLSNASTDEAAGEYAWEDLDHSYCFVKFNDEEGYPKHLFTDGSCTVEIAENGDVTVAGSFTGEDGNTYNIVLTYVAPVIPEEPIELNFEESMLEPYFYSDGSVELTAENEEAEVLLCYYVHEEKSALGEYTTDEFDLSWSYIYYAGQKLQFSEAHALVTEDEEGILHVAAELETAEGWKFIVTMFYEAAPEIVPEKKGEYLLEADNLVVDDYYASSYGVVILEASDDNVKLELYAYADAAGEDLAGEYVIGGEEKNAYGYVTGEAGEVEIYNGSFTVAFDNGSYAVDGVALAYDSIEYTFHLTFTMPDVTREEDITIEGLEFVVYDFGAWQIAGYNEDSTKYVSLAAYADEIPGDYATADLAASYCYVVVDITEEGTYNYFSLSEAALNVAIDGENGIVTGDFKGFDGETAALFHLNLTGIVGEPEDTEHPDDQEDDLIFNFAEYEVDDTNLAEYGSVYVEAMDLENMMYAILDITLPAGAEGLVPGEFDFAEEYAESTVYAGVYSSTYGYIPSFFCSIIEEEGKLYYGDEFWWPVEGKVTIDENLVVTVDAINSKGAKIQLILGSAEEAIDNVDAAVKATKRVVNGQLVIIKNGVEYNAQGAIIK